MRERGAKGVSVVVVAILRVTHKMCGLCKSKAKAIRKMMWLVAVARDVNGVAPRRWKERGVGEKVLFGKNVKTVGYQDQGGQKNNEGLWVARKMEFDRW